MKIINILLAFVVFLGGCSKREITKEGFDSIWKEYLKREFEESFDERQSVAQREKILGVILDEYKIELPDFKNYMKKEQEEKYKKIFLE